MRDNVSALSLLLLLPLLATLVLGIAVLRRGRRSTLGNVFLATLVSQAVWIAGHFFELLLTGRVSSDLWKQLKYLGMGPLPPLVFVLALLFCGRQRWLRPWLVVVLVLSGLVGFVGAVTDELHHQFFTNRGLLSTPDRPLFWLLVSLSYAYVLGASGLVLYDGLRRSAPQRRNSLLLAGSFLVPLVGNVLDGFGLIWPLDATVFLLAATDVLLAFSVFRCRLLDVAQVARRDVVDMMEDGVLVLDAEGRLVDSNLAAARLLGAASPEEVVDQFLSDLIARASGPIRQMAGSAEVCQARNGEAPQARQLELVASSPDRQTMVVQTYLLASDDGGYLGRVMVLHDATAHNRLVEHLDRSDEQLKAQQEALESVNLRLLQKNLELARAREELASLNHELEEKVRLRTAEVERRSREAEAERARIQAIMDHLPEGVIVLEGVDARVALANVAAHRLWLAPLEPDRPLSLSGSPPQQGWDADSVARLLDVVLREGRPVVGIRAVVVGSDGAERRILLNAAPLARHEGQPAAVVVFQDVTDLIESQEVKEEFLSIASHELRAPLTVIRGYAQALLHDLAADPESDHTRSLRAIERQASRMLALVNELLDVSRIEVGRLAINPEPTLVVDFLRRTFEEARIANPSHQIAFGFEPGMEPLVALWDPARIEQVVVNLIQNAAKYSPPTSQVSIRVKGGDGFVEVSVHDQGSGISRSAQRLVFERYYQAEETGDGQPGLGLGLYISREIVRAHGGRVWVVSEPGKGSAFHFILPLGHEPDDDPD